MWALAAYADDGGENTRRWVAGALQAELRQERADLNKVASLLFPLARQHPGDPAVAEGAAWIAKRSIEGLTCGQLADHLLIAGFATRAGRPVDTGALAARLADCRDGSDLFDLAGGLLFHCAFGPDTGERPAWLPEAVARLAGAQRSDGSFAGPDGRANFYLTSHATLALFHCEGPAAAVWRGERFMLRALPALWRGGYLDELAESLIFLAWMETPMRNWENFAAHVTGRRHPDGGLCFRDGPNCTAHWHATSLLLELEALARSGR
jgi:hypothetical protein